MVGTIRRQFMHITFLSPSFVEKIKFYTCPKLRPPKHHLLQTLQPINRDQNLIVFLILTSFKNIDTKQSTSMGSKIYLLLGLSLAIALLISSEVVSARDLAETEKNGMFWSPIFFFFILLIDLTHARRSNS